MRTTLLGAFALLLTGSAAQAAPPLEAFPGRHIEPSCTASEYLGGTPTATADACKAVCASKDGCDYAIWRDGDKVCHTCNLTRDLSGVSPGATRGQAMTSFCAGCADFAEATGFWKWEGKLLHLKADNTCTLSGSPILCHWKVGKKGPQDIVIFWGGHRSFHQMNLAPSGMTMDGHPQNAPQRKISAQRVAPPSPVGEWNTPHGVVSIKADRSCKRANDPIKCDWKFGKGGWMDVVIFWDGFRRFDQMTLTADGKTMNGHPQNQPKRTFTYTRK